MCWCIATQMYSVGRGFVGAMHLESMVRVLGYAELPVVIDAILKHMRQKVRGPEEQATSLVDSVPWKPSEIVGISQPSSFSPHTFDR